MSRQYPPNTLGLPMQPVGSRPSASLRRASTYGENGKPARPNAAPMPPLQDYRIDSSTSNGQASRSRPSGSSSRNGPRSSNGGPPQSRSAGSNDRAKSKVGGMLLQKRQSVSYAHAEANGMLPSSIPMPGLPQGGFSRNGQPKRVGGGGLDLDELNQEGLDVEAYLRNHFARNKSAGSNSDVLKTLQNNLKGSLDLTAQDLQKSVLANYTGFVSVAKELSALENEMLELKSVLEEWKTVPDSLELSSESDLLSSNSLAPGGRRGHRNSIADLAALYRSQLEALWENVEGSQKFLPYAPGRHLIAECSTFVELNAATYKPREPVHLFLLNDYLLIAVKKRRQMGSAVRLVAERCFSLNEIVVVDMKDGGELKHAVKVKRGKETFIFRSGKSEDKKALLVAFKKVAEEMSNKRRKESLWEAENRKGLSSSQREESTPSLPRPTKSSFDPSRIFSFVKPDPTGKDQSWIGDVSDELVVLISMRHFEQAVDLIITGREALTEIDDEATNSSFRTKMDARAQDLSLVLLQDLAKVSGKASVTRLSGWLTRLGGSDKARETFLSGRSDLVRQRVKQIGYEGDIPLYIGELAMVIFTLIKNTCEWYMAAFKDNKLSSSFVRWSTEQVQFFGEIFRRQVYGLDHDQSAILRDSLAITKSHGLMLKDVGLDFDFLLSALAEPKA